MFVESWRWFRVRVSGLFTLTSQLAAPSRIRAHFMQPTDGGDDG